MTYSPRPVPANIDASSQSYLANEFRKLRDALDVVEYLNLVERAAEPAKLSDGIVAYADGTNWDPGDGEGLYARVGGAWQSLVGVQPDEAETITGAWTFTTTLTVDAQLQVFGGNQFRVYEAADVHHVKVYHDGTDTVYDTTTGLHRFLDAVSIDGSYAALRPDGGSVSPLASVTRFTPDHAIGVVSHGADTEQLSFMLFNNDGSVNHRAAFFSDGTADEWGLWQTYSSGGNYNFVIGAAGADPRLEIDFSNDELTIRSELICADPGYACRLESVAPKLFFDETDATTDERLWDIVAAGGQLRYRILKDNQSASHDYMTVTRTGFSEALSVTPATLNLSPSGNVNVSPGGNFQCLSGNVVRAFDSGNTDYIDLYDNGSTGTLFTNNNPIRLYATSGAASVVVHPPQTIADEGTAEFNSNQTGYTMWFVGNSFNQNTQCIIAAAGAGARLLAGASANISLGTSGSNPNVDGDANYWTDSSGNLHVKNRLGSSRRFSAVCFSY